MVFKMLIFVNLTLYFNDLKLGKIKSNQKITHTIVQNKKILSDIKHTANFFLKKVSIQ